MIYLKLIPLIVYLVEAFVPPLDGDNDYIDVQNSLDDKGTGNVLGIELAEYYDNKIDEYNYANYYENYGDDYNLQYDNFYNARRGPGDRWPQGQGRFGGRPQRPEFGGRPQRPGFGGRGRPQGQGGFVGRPQRPGFGGRLQGQFGGRPQRPGFGGRPQGKGIFGGRPQRPEFGGGQGGFDGRPQRPEFGGRPQGQGGFGGRPQRPEFGGRPQGQGGFSGRPQGQGGFGGRPQRPGFGRQTQGQAVTKTRDITVFDFKNQKQEFWKKHLEPAVYNICRESGTETPGSGKYDKFSQKGIYYCNCCGGDFPLFSSSAKYDSRTGWPSFWEPISDSRVNLTVENDGTNRIEVSCSRCGGHLGHVFDDGPADKTGKRFCMNSLALHFVPELGEAKNLFSTL